ncbi:BREX system ATP-binding domain-containing protein [Candidatus Chloroploca asiatica]|uniref:Uncharacterized protein n=1 Tax=Candidatus Chloroploca asiatica TaxID=1506545 RepID=A0A2H3LDD0_9CHLR|nr:BREX system ATP-binding domain-containing protein [Candidatus Chloroploca asiatica]PDW00581.1 hypothetical protein A9Q02_09330 [Candidatus Chloroploca asiatica]
MSDTNLSPLLALRIIQALGGPGTPPEEGLQHFSVGLDPYLNVLDDEYLDRYIQYGGASFKMVVGIYGGGKTHFLYSLRDRARAKHYAVSYVSLKSSGESPFYALDLVYKAIAAGLLPPDDGTDQHIDRGIRSFLRAWYGKRLQTYQTQEMSLDRARECLADDIRQIDLPNLNYRTAVRKALESYHNNRQEAFDQVCQWLQGEGFDRRALQHYGINQKLDRSTAFPMIRAMVRMVRELGYSGLVVLLDEAERIPSLSTRNREQLLSNLREMIDECGQSSFEGMFIVYAVPDQNFLEGRTQVYEALKQRLSTVFTEINPTGVKVMLEQTVGDHTMFLHTLGTKLAQIYEVAYQCSFDAQELNEMVIMVADWAEDQRFGDEGYKRLFVQTMVAGLHYLNHHGICPTLTEITRKP